MTVTFCRKCQALVEEGQAFCSRCYTPVKQQPLLKRLVERFVGWLGGSVDVDGDRPSRRISSTNVTIRKSEHFTFHDKTTGETREFGSFDELPDDIRAMVESAKNAIASPGTMKEETIKKRITSAPDGKEVREITVRGFDGIERRYSSVEELPPEVRRMLDEFRGV